MHVFISYEFLRVSMGRQRYNYFKFRTTKAAAFAPKRGKYRAVSAPVRRFRRPRVRIRLISCSAFCQKMQYFFRKPLHLFPQSGKRLPASGCWPERNTHAEKHTGAGRLYYVKRGKKISCCSIFLALL
jgi:hypothetical protein